MLVVIVGIAILIVGYIFYGGWLAKQWGVDDSKVTPAHELEDGMDYVPAKAPVLMGHHFSSIAGAGPIQAAVFGWVPVVLWVLIGGIFFGAVHDYGALFASIRHKGQSLGEVVALNIGERAKKLFLTFSYLTLVLVVAAFASIVASTFQATYVDGVVDVAASGTNASVAMISLLFIIMAILFGFFVYRRGASLSVATIVGVIGIVICLAIGLKWHPIYLSNTAWMWIIGVYILIASVAPVWILLQPRDYLSSFLLYAMMVIAAVGVIGAGLTGADAAHMDMPAFTGAYDTIAPTETSLGYVFPALFVTIACGAISGFHSLVGSGTTAKQLDHERDAKPIAYGGMLIECALALISLSAVSFIWNEYASGEIVTPTQVFATGISRMVASIPGLAGAQSTISSLLVLTVSVFCLTSLDTATRLARYMFQEFWLEPGQTYKDATGFKAILCNPFVATVITVVLGVGLGMTGYSKIWPLFGAANQLLAALALLTVCAWLGNIGRNNKMFYIPMAFMLVVTLTSLVQTITTQAGKIMAAGGMPLDKAGNFDWAPYAQSILGAALFVLAIVLAVEGCKTIFGKKKAA